MAEGTSGPGPEAPKVAAQEKNPLLERIGKDKLRAVASIALAGAVALGISGKVDGGGAVGAETYNPVTGEPVSVGITAQTGQEGLYGLGIPDDVIKRMKNPEVYKARVGGATIAVFVGGRESEGPGIAKSVTVYAGAETPQQKMAPSRVSTRRS